jgi:hypothetical protein
MFRLPRPRLCTGRWSTPHLGDVHVEDLLLGQQALPAARPALVAGRRGVPRLPARPARLLHLLHHAGAQRPQLHLQRKSQCPQVSLPASSSLCLLACPQAADGRQGIQSQSRSLQGMDGLCSAAAGKRTCNWSSCTKQARCKTLTVTPAPWHCSHWYRLPDFVPAPAHVLHLMFRDSDSFLQAPHRSSRIASSPMQGNCGASLWQAREPHAPSAVQEQSSVWACPSPTCCCRCTAPPG